MHKGYSNCLPGFFITVFFILGSLGSYGQPPVNNITGKVTQPVNINDPQLRDYLRDQNSDAGVDKNTEFIKNTRKSDKDSIVAPKRHVVSDPKSTYGANTFSGTAGFNISELSTPPLDYPIGVGDHIIVSMYGGAEYQGNYLVGTDGSIFPSGVGKIFVGGISFENVQRLLYARFSAVVPGGTNIDISLGQPRSINVNVVNEVNEPGIVTVSAFTNAFQVIARAGGVTDNGNLRNIIIKRNGRVIEELDVYKYLQTGDFGKHIYLQNNDFIIVPFYEKKVLATGQFKRPMYYQLRKDEGVKALLKFSGGLNSDALSSILHILRSENENQVIRDVNTNAIMKNSGQDEILEDGDIVKADIIRPGLINKVEVRGEIKYPDIYEIRPGDKLFDIINRAGGVTRNTYLKRAYIFRGAGDSVSLQADKIEVDLTDINDNKINSPSNIALRANDVIQIFGSYEFSDPVYVEIFGEVRKEGKLRKYGGMTLQDLLYLSGGLKPSAEFGRLEISSIVDVDSARKGLKPTRTIIKSYSIDQNLQLDSAASKVIIKPYDQVFARKNPTFELQENVELKGLIKYPGLYPRLSKHETLSSFINRAGGFKENANLAGAVLYRRKTENFRESVVVQAKYDSMGNVMPEMIESINGARNLSADNRKANMNEPVSIDLYRALKYKNTKYDIVLQENDVVFVPEINPFVTVAGRVQSPLKISFDKEHTNVPYYIDKAGGFGVKPWRRRVFVTYANGRSRRTHNFLFFHFYPPVEEGAYITIPRRPEGQEIADIAKGALASVVPIILSAILLKYIK